MKRLFYLLVIIGFVGSGLVSCEKVDDGGVGDVVVDGTGSESESESEDGTGDGSEDGSEDGSGDESGTGAEDSLAKKLSSYDNGTMTYKLTYDDNGRVIECAEWEGDIRIFGVRILYQEDGSVEYDSEREVTEKITLENGIPVKIDDETTLSYDADSHLMSYTGRNESATYKWSEGNLTETTTTSFGSSLTTTFTYTEYDNKFNFDWWSKYTLDIPEYYIYFTGPATKNLVATSVFTNYSGNTITTTYEYEFDKDGYVTKATATTQTTEYIDVYTVSFTYE